MAFPLPETLTPSKLSSYRQCPLAFRYANIDKLPDPPSIASTRGNIVHLALEYLYQREPEDRTLTAGLEDLDLAFEALEDDRIVTELGLSAQELDELRVSSRSLIYRYFMAEDPVTVRPLGVEVKLQTNLGGATIRGIIDRLDGVGTAGYVATDFKTGKSPKPRYQAERMSGVLFYALLLREILGVLPSSVRLVFLADGVVVSQQVTEHAVNDFQRQVEKAWAGIVRDCEAEVFKPRVTPLCPWCSFRAYCPAQGGTMVEFRPRQS